MNTYWFALAVFFAAFTINMLYITVFYHRALTHRAVTLTPWGRRFVIATGQWVTGLDIKTWCCMHRLHHSYSDTVKDPHSPVHLGIFGVLRAQIDAFAKTRLSLIAGEAEYVAISKDLDFPVSWLSRTSVFWVAPYLLHAVIAVALGCLSHGWMLGLFYWLGMMSHPVQGWLVNAFAHRYGYRNFPTSDNSRNNTLVAWLTMGEGLQNNHHRCPRAANFARRGWEVDLGYGLCKLSAALGLIRIARPRSYGRRRPRPAAGLGEAPTALRPKANGLQEICYSLSPEPDAG